MFQKRHYKALVELLIKSPNLTEFYENLIQYLKYDNPLFNETKFRQAVKFYDTHATE